MGRPEKEKEVMIKMAVLFWQDSHRTLYHGDCRNMKELSDESAQMICTSPPYWGLRKYAGLPDLIWGNQECEHQWHTQEWFMHNGRGDAQKSGKYSTQESIPDVPQSDNTCSLCGAWQGSFGLEPSPEMYVTHTVEILREIRRVLRKDGVVFWNIGDSYYSSPSNQQGKGNPNSGVGVRGCQAVGRVHLPQHNTLKPKDLCLIPFRVAIAAQDDGWWVRSVIIWNKPNPMPESVTDRPTESHEYILMLTKSAKYYWDAEAVREPQLQQSIDRMTRNHLTDYDPGYPTHGYQNLHFGEKMSRDEAKSLGGRNLRSVWTFPTFPFSGAHFATFPPKLVEICVKASTPEVGCCSSCGKPYERITQETAEYSQARKHGGWNKAKDILLEGNRKDAPTLTRQTETLGWRPQCKCNADKIPSIVLDPFAGSGTTLKVAAELNRRAVGYELSEEYCKLAVERNKQEVLV